MVLAQSAGWLLRERNTNSRQGAVLLRQTVKCKGWPNMLAAAICCALCLLHFSNSTGAAPFASAAAASCTRGSFSASVAPAPAASAFFGLWLLLRLL